MIPLIFAILTTQCPLCMDVRTGRFLFIIFLDSLKLVKICDGEKRNQLFDYNKELNERLFGFGIHKSSLVGWH